MEYSVRYFSGVLGSLVVQYFDVAIGMIHGFTFNHLIPIALGVPISGSEMTYRGRSSHFVQGKWASFFTRKGYHGQCKPWINKP